VRLDRPIEIHVRRSTGQIETESARLVIECLECFQERALRIDYNGQTGSERE
jgi:hypothetical protein